jgi:hypothetical protein
MARKIEIPNLRRACIGFPDDELEAIDEIADEQDTTRSGFIREVVRKALGKNPLNQPGPDSLGDVPEHDKDSNIIGDYPLSE